MKRGIIGSIVGSVLVAIWIVLGFGNLLLIVLAGMVGYLIATITGSAEDKSSLRSKITKILQIKE
ncbi:hypothetical protein [Companilactobacillus bobalius]|uniref:DUF2273 domain-containing protein n=2 Tax=Companilactobacillus bobalius TaxID=2801451 RepID=A0A202FA66_9LACO|nr:hypothetical protein [Companilactobacillus bobalius]KAE9564292.1 hypothetical protein ATN92_01005 [Companilactobacillus bobalius]KRK83993.1 hypothetical protein FC78_GL000999 [Companilactobacillus bobalius DSM 19674]OVE97318.1 hypothetical protein LKACC16343_01808 [Companilactobacillus bobalius]GEO58295.1 hypothetical protein LBO01_14240 [Companilactobacillus paralimentarius]